MRRIWLLTSCIALFGMSCPQGEDWLVANSFQGVVPPSNMLTVGSVVAIEEECSDGVSTSKYKLLCGPRASLGPYFAPVSNSTSTQSFRNHTRTSWSLDGAIMDSVKGTSSGSKIKKIKAHLRNARILSLSDADVLENLPNRSEECRQAIKARLEQNYTVTMISTALLGDMSYEVEWEDTGKINKQARLKEMQQVAVSLGSGYEHIGLKSIQSKGLALGIRTDAFLLTLSVPDIDDDHKERVEQAHRDKKPSRDPMAVDSNPDAPLVLPGNASYVAPTFSDDE